MNRMVLSAALFLTLGLCDDQALPSVVASPQFSVRQVNLPAGAYLASRDTAFFLRTDYAAAKQPTGIVKSMIYRMPLGGGEAVPLLDSKVTEKWFAQKSATDTRLSQIGLHGIIQNRWLVATAINQEERVMKRVVYFVVDLTSMATRSYEIAPTQDVIPGRSVVAAGSDWIVINRGPDELNADRTKPGKGIPTVDLVKGAGITTLGTGSAVGVDTKGRIYANDLVDSRGQSVPPRTPNAEQVAKVYENGAWKIIGHGAIWIVNSDGSLVTMQIVDKAMVIYGVKDGTWNLLEGDWQKEKMWPSRRAEDGSLLLREAVPPAPDTVRGAISSGGVMIRFSELLPQGFSSLSGGQMAPDGSVLIHGKIGEVETSYLITRSP